MHLFFQTSFPQGTYDWGTTWFLNQLMIFSIVYAITCGRDWNFKMACPSIIGFYAIGFVLGVLTCTVAPFVDRDSQFFAVPGFWINYPSYPFYFFGGAIAQRNGWLESIEKKSRMAIYASSLFIFIATVAFVAFFGTYDSLAGGIGQIILRKGLLSVSLSMSVTVFFMDYANKKYWCTDFFSKAMYTAYIIQYVFPMLFALRCVLWILDATGNVAYDGEPSLDSMYITNDNLIFPSWLLVSTITLLIVWPMAYAIRSIPGFSKVL